MLIIKFVVSNGIESFVMARSPVLAGQLDEQSKADETHPAPWKSESLRCKLSVRIRWLKANLYTSHVVQPSEH